ncbi:sensor histidine kinase [Arenibaculum pallidiluteum]|uniref:sensor histidine kinase n=1 Tax=Arenibaculum pallidiluteum TaxID=2812559 RepID=UPI001A95CCE6|nr:histidine kinase dimerization/phosphoacceptor domain -containing protein [Arenibaculum pallidiluteum]
MTGQGGDDRFRLLADHAPVMIWQAGPDLGRIFLNAQWLRFTGRPAEDEVGLGWTDGIHPDDAPRVTAVMASALAARDSFEVEYRLRRHDGAWRWILDHGCPCVLEGGVFEGYCGSAHDVTERREAEERARREVAEKEALLLEVHHRTRNTLQTVIGLLNLQAANTSDPDARALLGETVQRVQALGLTQDTAYQTQDYTRVELGPLVERIASGLKLHHDRPDVSVLVDLGYACLPLEAAVPLGLLLNELIANALRHAYPAGQAGTIRVTALPRADGRLAVSVEDEGRGLPPETEVRGGLGLKLARILAGQLRAELDVRSGPGVRFSVVLPPPRP